MARYRNGSLDQALGIVPADVLLCQLHVALSYPSFYQMHLAPIIAFIHLCERLTCKAIIGQIEVSQVRPCCGQLAWQRAGHEVACDGESLHPVKPGPCSHWQCACTPQTTRRMGIARQECQYQDTQTAQHAIECWYCTTLHV